MYVSTEPTWWAVTKVVFRDTIIEMMHLFQYISTLDATGYHICTCDRNNWKTTVKELPVALLKVNSFTSFRGAEQPFCGTAFFRKSICREFFGWQLLIMDMFMFLQISGPNDSWIIVWKSDNSDNSWINVTERHTNSDTKICKFLLI